jgi:dTMP kinase
MKGIFISFEGGEGSGKTTQMEKLGQALLERGLPVILTREPGGTPLGREIRAILLHGCNHHIHPLTELLLYAADRAQHVQEVLQPALQRGEIILCDRYQDSTWVYQGAGRELPRDWIETLGKMATQGLQPQLTFLLDCPPEIGLMRSRRRLSSQQLSEDRFENEDLEFHQKIREGFLQLAKKEAKRFVVFDATLDAQKLHLQILKCFEERFS